MPMPKRPMPSRFPKFSEPPKAVAALRTAGAMPLPLSYTAMSIVPPSLLCAWRKKNADFVRAGLIRVIDVFTERRGGVVISHIAQ